MALSDNNYQQWTRTVENHRLTESAPESRGIFVFNNSIREIHIICHEDGKEFEFKQFEKDWKLIEKLYCKLKSGINILCLCKLRAKGYTIAWHSDPGDGFDFRVELTNNGKIAYICPRSFPYQCPENNEKKFLNPNYYNGEGFRPSYQMGADTWRLSYGPRSPYSLKKIVGSLLAKFNVQKIMMFNYHYALIHSMLDENRISLLMMNAEDEFEGSCYHD